MAVAKHCPEQRESSWVELGQRNHCPARAGTLQRATCSEQCSLKTTNTFKIANGSRDSSSPTLQKCPLGTMDAIDTSLVWDFLWDWHQKVAPQRFPTSMESAQETPRRSFHTGPVKGRGAEALSFLLGIFLPAESE